MDSLARFGEARELHQNSLDGRTQVGERAMERRTNESPSGEKDEGMSGGGGDDAKFPEKEEEEENRRKAPNKLAW